MLGHTLFARFSERRDMEVFATVRTLEGISQLFSPSLLLNIKPGVDADNFQSIQNVLADLKPDVVINCIGIIKQLPGAKDPVSTIALNALFPHKLARSCREVGARMIHISTDCVFSGKKGNYTEIDFADCDDLYGRTKYLGEVAYPHCITLRTSIIGHELKGKFGLVDWFLSQKGPVRGFTRAIYTGFPTVEMAKIIANIVIPDETLSGLYHVSSKPISKYELLSLVAERYGKKIQIDRYDEFQCDRSLDSSRFQNKTNYIPPSWPEMVDKMYMDFSRR